MVHYRVYLLTVAAVWLGVPGLKLLFVRLYIARVHLVCQVRIAKLLKPKGVHQVPHVVLYELLSVDSCRHITRKELDELPTGGKLGRILQGGVNRPHTRI